MSDLVKPECINALLLRDMNISRLMTHAQHVDDDKLREQAKKIRRLGLGTMTILSKNQVVEISRRVSRSFWLHPLNQLVLHSPRTGMIRRVQHQALNLREVF